MNTRVVAHQTFALRILTWLQDVTGYSDGLRQLFTKQSLEPPPCQRSAEDMECTNTQHSVVEDVMLSDTLLWKAARVTSHRLFMTGILMDVECKKTFAIMFTKHYACVTSDFVRDDHYRSISISKCSVQLFTVHSLSRLLVAQHNLLPVILDAFLSHCTTRLNASRQLTFEKHERNSSFLRAQYMIHDLRYVLTNRPVSSEEWTTELREGFLNGFNSLLLLLQYMQGMDGVRRQTVQHVEYEPEWEGAFNLQLKLSDILTMVLDWCASDQSVSLEAYNRTFAALSEVNALKPRREHCTVTVSEHTSICTVYDFTIHPVSVHLPLTRLLASLYVILDEPQECSTVDDLMQPSVHTLVLVAQCQAGMWRRNGYSLQNQVYFYQNARCRAEMFDKDIVMIQMGASLMDSNQFIIYLLYKFGLTNWIRMEYDTDVTQEDSVNK